MSQPQESMLQFSKEFGELINRAISQRVPLTHILSEVDQTHFQLHSILLNLKMEAQAQIATKAIIPANGFKMPPPRG